MDMDEWGKEAFDEWEIESYDLSPTMMTSSISSGTGDQNNITYVNSQIPSNTSGPFPEVEIGSSSDEEAPPIPESSQLARENLQLRARVEQLVQQSKSSDNQNKSLKKQLFKCRNLFKVQIKSMKKAFK